jgi:hypothetical protein
VHVARLFPVVLLALVAVSGCGGGDAPSVAELDRSIVTARDQADLALARVTQASNEEELLGRMEEAGAAIEDAAGALEAGGAAAGYEDGVAELVESLRQLAVDVRATAEQLRTPGFEGLLTGAQGLSFESWNRVNAALAGLRREGIEVEPLARH